MRELTMAKYLVSTPVPGYTGMAAGVNFTDGHADVDEVTQAAALAYFRAAGYDVQEANAAPTPELTVPVGDGDQAAADDTSGAEGDTPLHSAMPSRRGSTDTWRAYAVEHGGMSLEEAEGLSRDQLVEHYTSEEKS